MSSKRRRNVSKKSGADAESGDDEKRRRGDDVKGLSDELRRELLSSFRVESSFFFLEKKSRLPFIIIACSRALKAF